MVHWGIRVVPGRIAACGLSILISAGASFSAFGPASVVALTLELSSSPTSLKLMTFNIHGWRDSTHQCNFDRIATVVREVNPDILCLNEVLHPFATPSGSDKAANQQVIDDYYKQVQQNQGRGKTIHPSFVQSQEDSFLSRLSKATNLPNVQFVGATDNSFFGKGIWFGNAILSTHPIDDFLPVPLPIEPGDIDLGNQERDFVDPRSFGVAKVKFDDNQHCIGIAFGHLDHKSEELREKQILKVLEDTRDVLSDVPHLICGDFNAFQKSDCDPKGWKAILNLFQTRGWPTPYERSLALDALKDAGYLDSFYESYGQQDGTAKQVPDATSWTTLPLMRIDHILVKNSVAQSPSSLPAILPKEHYQIDTDASDHFPVVLEALLQQPGAEILRQAD
ncbi:Endonuclease Exonuclease phosphatase [Seminavis robusta]|uniref:Endonuclease Exonuclease phosphatase n=1 Tax=Seminavis robusta TaxID=568900 RepID=A0A9N8GZC3_9STRA|nr:Endonuclease Exonuclease phosphatase [Seminavis robusta]|eukprot:Sro2_g001390.1 Endonuclease Exonuclease phosphatase (393) ;mRNA; f:139473-140651